MRRRRTMDKYHIVFGWFLLTQQKTNPLPLLPSMSVTGSLLQVVKASSSPPPFLEIFTEATIEGQGADIRPVHYAFFGGEHRRQTKSPNCPAPAEIVQPRRNCPAAEEICTQLIL